MIVVVVLVALTWKSRPGRTLSLRSRRQAKIQRAAAEDVAALQQNDRFISPDSPGLHEDDL